MRVLALVFKRIAYAVLLIAAVLTINFALIHAAPGDPAMVIAGEMGGADEAVLAQIRKTYGLDKPVLVQYATYVGQAVRGDLGQSYLYNQPVVDLIMDRLRATVLLVLSALLGAILFGTFMGVWASRRPDSIAGSAGDDQRTGRLFDAGVLDRHPAGDPVRQGVSGDADLGHDRCAAVRRWLVAALDVLHHLVLPAFTLAIIYLAQYSRLSRASMLEVLGSDYIRTARAKGWPRMSSSTSTRCATR